MTVYNNLAFIYEALVLSLEQPPKSSILTENVFTTMFHELNRNVLIFHKLLYTQLFQS